MILCKSLNDWLAYLLSLIYHPTTAMDTTAITTHQQITTGTS